MAVRRADRIASAVRQEVVRRLQIETRAPELEGLTVTEVTVNRDGSVARIRYLPLGGMPSAELANRIQGALDVTARRLRGPVGRALGIRHAPELRFELDRNLDHALHIEKLLQNLPEPAPEEEE